MTTHTRRRNLTWRPSRRDLRLGSGIILFAYIAVHLVDHALGLVSVSLAERALALSVRVWHSFPGTLLLYGAASIHVALAFVSLYERRTLRMPAIQLLRIVLGFGMPLLVIGHVVATRLAADLHQLAPTYERIVWALWRSDGEGRQLALLVPGWLHGCLGLQFAFGRSRAWSRLRLPLFGIALLLPVLAGLGFLAMGRELAGLAVDGGGPATVATASAAQRIALGRLRDGVLFTYFGLIGAVLLARVVRARMERSRNAIVEIRFPQHTVDVPRGWTVLEAARSFGIPHLSLCGGNARCSTCRVRIVAGAGLCPPPDLREQRTLERISAPDDVRLACQLRPSGSIAVAPILDAAHTPGSDAANPLAVTEREVAVLFVRLVRWRETGNVTHSPHDVIYALNRALALVGDAVTAAGGHCGRLDNEGGMAWFDLRADGPSAYLGALRAAATIDSSLVALEARLGAEIGFSGDFVLALHVGTAVVGPLGYGLDSPQSVVGETVLAGRALRDFAANTGMRFVVSRATAEAAQLLCDGVQWHPVAVAPGRAPLEALAVEREPRIAAALQSGCSA